MTRGRRRCCDGAISFEARSGARMEGRWRAAVGRFALAEWDRPRSWGGGRVQNETNGEMAMISVAPVETLQRPSLPRARGPLAEQSHPRKPKDFSVRGGDAAAALRRRRDRRVGGRHARPKPKNENRLPCKSIADRLQIPALCNEGKIALSRDASTGTLPRAAVIADEGAPCSHRKVRARAQPKSVAREGLVGDFAHAVQAHVPP